MKKIFALLICIIMVLSLAACGSGDNTDTTTVPATTEAQTPPPQFMFGTTYGTSYNNTTMGIGISLPSEFIITSTEELAEMNGFDEELMTTNLPEAMVNTLRAYIFVATDNAGNYMNIIVENLQIPNTTFIAGSKYFEIYAEETKKEYEDMGATDVTLTPTKVTIAGMEHDVELINYTLDGIAACDTRISFPAGNFIAIMTLKGDTDLILNRTYSL